jgi:hypothetical protein
MRNLKLGNAFAALALGGALVLATAPKAHADDHDHGNRAKCQNRVEKANHKYREEVREHGRHSEQAERAKSRLSSEWDRCYSESRGWYDPHRREWRNDRDWDRNYNWDDDDRDRDHDRH